MRARAVGVVLAAGVFAAAPWSAARAAERVTSISFSGSGSLTVVWHGDRAGGCETAGLCGYSGEISYPRIAHADLDLLAGRNSLLDLGGLVDSEGRTVVRVRREVAGGSPVACVDTADAPTFTLEAARAYRGRHRLSLGTDISPAPVASGQCAGPRLADFAQSLPAAVFRLHRIVRRGARVNLAGRFRFAAGPVAGEVISTVRLRSDGALSSRLDVGPPVRHAKRMLLVDLTFAVRRASGEVAADFRAVDAPVCHVLDACGTSGRESYAVAADEGKLVAFGIAPARGRRVPTVKAAIAAVLRRGFLSGFGALAPGSSLTVGLLSRDGGEVCTDRFRPAAGPELLLAGGRGRVSLDLGGDELSGGGSDVLRSRCPGPTQEQVLDGTPLAAGTFPARALTRRQVHATLAGAGAFAAEAFRGTRKSRLEIDLARTRTHVHLARVGG